MPGVAEVTLTEAHKDLLASVDHVGAALLVVAGGPCHALPLRGDAVVLADHGVYPNALYDLSAPPGGAGRLVHYGYVGRLLPLA